LPGCELGIVAVTVGCGLEGVDQSVIFAIQAFLYVFRHSFLLLYGGEHRELDPVQGAT
jgi:hypothetical protein